MTRPDPTSGPGWQVKKLRGLSRVGSEGVRNLTGRVESGRVVGSGRVGSVREGREGSGGYRNLTGRVG